jgi:hypothetical protein
MTEQITSPSSELRRIDFTGTIWFAAAIVAVGLPLAGLLAHGWRPGFLPAVDGVIWWVGAALTFAGILAFAWSGCPVIGAPVPKVDTRKSISIRAGVILYVFGSAAALLAVLVSS